MKCLRHDKDIIGLCSWCGKQVCKACVVLEEKNTRYCINCADKVAEFRKLPKPEFLKQKTQPKEGQLDEFRVEVY